ncbi:hypothetical protein Ancab_017235 [Ancistrocladus abbreviatus]
MPISINKKKEFPCSVVYERIAANSSIFKSATELWGNKSPLFLPYPEIEAAVGHRLAASFHYQQQKMFLGQQSKNRDKIRRVRKELQVNQFFSTAASSSFSMMGHQILDDASASCD